MGVIGICVEHGRSNPDVLMLQVFVKEITPCVLEIWIQRINMLFLYFFKMCDTEIKKNKKVRVW